MPRLPNLAWRSICDFLLEMEGAAEPDELCRRAARALEGLIPYDSIILATGEPDGERIEMMEGIGIERRYIEAYLDYYNRLDPHKTMLIQAGRVSCIDMCRYRQTEFYTDFIAPQRIRFSLGILMRDTDQAKAVALPKAGGWIMPARVCLQRRQSAGGWDNR